MILITGDSGFIGGHLSRYLTDAGESVRGLDKVPRETKSRHYPQIVGDVLDPLAVGNALENVDTVIHLAAEHKDAGIDRDQYFRVNVEGTRNLLSLASEVKIRRFVLFSSVAVYGDSDFPSEESPPRPSNAYGESKLEAEHLVQSWGSEDASRVAIIIRPTVVFGPGNRANIFRLIRYVCDGKFVWIGKGENVKALAYVENVVEGTVFLLNHMKRGVEIFNYADEPQMMTRELVALIARKAGLERPTLSIPMGIAIPAAKVMDAIGKLARREFAVSSARITKFNTDTRYRVDKLRSAGFRPQISLEEGMERNVRWYKELKALQGEFRILRIEESSE